MIFVLIFLGILFLGVSGLVIFMAERAFGGQDFKTNQETINQVADILKKRHLESGNFYDLGSGGGELVLKIGKALPQLQITGIDDSSLRILLSKVRSIFQKNVKFKKENIFKIDISSAEAVYVYLPQELMPGLQEKFQKELKPGCLVISSKVSFPNWQPVEKVNELFVYKKLIFNHMQPGKDFIGVGVGAVILNDDGKVFLMQRGPKSRNEVGTWTIPGGTVEFGETLENAIVREIKEEMDIDIWPIRQLGEANHIMEKEKQHWVSTIFLCKITGGEPKIMEPEKCSQIGWFSLEEIPKLPLGVIMTENLKLMNNLSNE